jgi:hypothetical protein
MGRTCMKFPLHQVERNKNLIYFMTSAAGMKGISTTVDYETRAKASFDVLCLLSSCQ